MWWSLSRNNDASILSWPAIKGHYKLWIATFRREIRYGRQLRSLRQMPHQVTYDVVAMSIRPK
eukprot:scaffold1916_cov85-Skeletonema_dohrnii-CCMP3373.AAC.2